MRNAKKIETDGPAEFFSAIYRKDEDFPRTKLHRCQLLMKRELNFKKYSNLNLNVFCPLVKAKNKFSK